MDGLRHSTSPTPFKIPNQASNNLRLQFLYCSSLKFGLNLDKISNQAIWKKSWKNPFSLLVEPRIQGAENRSSSEIIQPHRATMSTRFLFLLVVSIAALALLASVAAADGPPRTCAELCEVARKACFAACKTDEWDCICSIKFKACVSKCGSVE